MENHKKVIGIGRAFTDVLADVDEAFLKKFNIPKGIGVRLDAAEIETIRAELINPVYMGGGSVANTISGLNVLGVESIFIGKSADDTSGAMFRRAFEEEGVAFPVPAFAGGGSGTCLCLNTPDGDRSFAFSVGICQDLTPELMPVDLFSEAQMLLVTVLMMETYVCYESVRDLLPRLPPSVKKVMCLHDLHDKGKLWDLALEHADILIGSRTEFNYIMGINTAEALEAFAKERNVLAIMTCGVDGAVLSCPAETVSVPSIPPLEIVDSVGAGDHFAAGVLYGILEGWSLTRAGNLGAGCASLILEQVGARPNPETKVRMQALR